MESKYYSEEKQKPQDDCKEPQGKDSTETSQKECSRKPKPQVCLTMQRKIMARKRLQESSENETRAPLNKK